MAVTLQLSEGRDGQSEGDESTFPYLISVMNGRYTCTRHLVCAVEYNTRRGWYAKRYCAALIRVDATWVAVTLQQGGCRDGQDEGDESTFSYLTSVMNGRCTCTSDLVCAVEYNARHSWYVER